MSTRERQTRRFTGEGFFEDTFAPMPASVHAKKYLIVQALKAARATTDNLLKKIDTDLDEPQPPLMRESPPDEPRRRPESYRYVDEMPDALRILALTALDATAEVQQQEKTQETA